MNVKEPAAPRHAGYLRRRVARRGGAQRQQRCGERRASSSSTAAIARAATGWRETARPTATTRRCWATAPSAHRTGTTWSWSCWRGWTGKARATVTAQEIGTFRTPTGPTPPYGRIAAAAAALVLLVVAGIVMLLRRRRVRPHPA